MCRCFGYRKRKLNDFLKRATGAGALFAANDYNFGIRPANILPVGDLTGIDLDVYKRQASGVCQR